jgi:hypothetical protein
MNTFAVVLSAFRQDLFNLGQTAVQYECSKMSINRASTLFSSADFIG